MTDTDTIIIPRDLFERLCEAAEFTNRYHRWYETTCGVRDENCIWRKTYNEAVAIRDSAK